jgi:hypothetical protein
MLPTYFPTLLHIFIIFSHYATLYYISLALHLLHTMNITCIFMLPFFYLQGNYHQFPLAPTPNHHSLGLLHVPLFSLPYQITNFIILRKLISLINNVPIHLFFWDVRKTGPWSNKIKQMQKQNTEDTQYKRDIDLCGSPSVGYVHQRNCQVLPLLLSSK